MRLSGSNRVVVALAVAGLLLSVSAGADWTQMGGPNRDNVSPEKGLARTWPEGGPKVLWTLPVSGGYGAPAVSGNEAYLLDRLGEQQEVLRCIDVNTGKELWNFAYDAPGEVSHNGTRTVPTVDDKYVYSVGMMGNFHCIDRKTHQPVWNKNLIAEFNVEGPRWGFAQAPSLYKDLVIVAPQAPDAFVVAFKRETGDVVWRSAGLGLVGYVAPVVATLCGVDQVVMIGASSKDGTKLGSVAGISIEDGSALWSYAGWQCYLPIPFPTALPGDRLFITGGYKAGSAMIQIKRENGKFAVQELFKTDMCGSQLHQPILFQDHLYMNSNSNEREDGMLCLTLDGQVKWKSHDVAEAPTFERGALLFADNMFFDLDGKTGILHLIAPSPDGLKVAATVPILSGKEIWAPMALSEGKLFVRSQSEMKCLDVKNP